MIHANDAVYSVNQRIYGLTLSDFARSHFLHKIEMEIRECEVVRPRKRQRVSHGRAACEQQCLALAHRVSKRPLRLEVIALLRIQLGGALCGTEHRESEQANLLLDSEGIEGSVSVGIGAWFLTNPDNREHV